MTVSERKNTQRRQLDDISDTGIRIIPATAKKAEVEKVQNKGGHISGVLLCFVPCFVLHRSRIIQHFVEKCNIILQFHPIICDIHNIFLLYGSTIIWVSSVSYPGTWRSMDKELPLSGGLCSPNKGRFASVQGGSGVPTPTRLTMGTNEPTGKIWATGRILRSAHSKVLCGHSVQYLIPGLYFSPITPALSKS